jgi:hypothetical protein
MWVGEGGDLWSERARVIGPDLRRKSYHFQIRNDDGREHFRGVSTRYPSLHLVLVNYWGLPSECSSFLIHGGRSRAYRMPDELVNSILMKHGYDPDLDSDNDDEHMENDDKEWEASWEMMDVAESRWLDGLLRRIRQA